MKNQPHNNPEQDDKQQPDVVSSSSLRQFSIRTEQVMREAMQRSDSVLSEEEEDEEAYRSSFTQHQQKRRQTEVYLEAASIEVSQEDHRSVTTNEKNRAKQDKNYLNQESSSSLLEQSQRSSARQISEDLSLGSLSLNHEKKSGSQSALHPTAERPASTATSPDSLPQIIQTPKDLRSVLNQATTTTTSSLTRPLSSRFALLQRLQENNSTRMQAKQPRGPFFQCSHSHHKLQRTIYGLSHWPFRNDFGMACWFQLNETDSTVVLLRIQQRPEDGGGGIEISLEEATSPTTSRTSDTTTSFVIGIHIYDAHKTDRPVQSVRVTNCVLLPNVWYHIAVRHSRSFKGVFSRSLSSRQHVTVLLDGKLLLSESASLVFPTFDSGQQKMNLHIHAQSYRMGTLYLFHDHVSDASFRKLYHMTRSEKYHDKYNQHRYLKYASIFDMGEDEQEEFLYFPKELSKAQFGSKVYLVWDPARVVHHIAVELHVGAHVPLLLDKQDSDVDDHDGVLCVCTKDPSDVIASIGGVQALIPLFRSLSGEAVIEKEGEEPLPVLPGLFRILAAFLRGHERNAREFLRCGGVDVLEQILFVNKKNSVKTKNSFYYVSRYHQLAQSLIDSLMDFCSSCSHYPALESKIYSRILFNTNIWIADLKGLPGVSLLVLYLPMMSSVATRNPDKVRDLVGMERFLALLVEFLSSANFDNPENSDDERKDRFCDPTTYGCGGELTRKEIFHATRLLLGILFEILSGGATVEDMKHFVHFLSKHLESVYFQKAPPSPEPAFTESDLLLISPVVVLMLLLEVRPVVPGLLDNFAEACGSVSSAVAFVLRSMVLHKNDAVRSCGVRTVVAIVDVTGETPDSILRVPNSKVVEENTTKPSLLRESSSSMFLAPTRVAEMAKGFVPRQRSESKSVPKVHASTVMKLMWHFLKTQRGDLGVCTHFALLTISRESSLIFPSCFSSLNHLKLYVTETDNSFQGSRKLSYNWKETLYQSDNNVISTVLNNTMTLSTIFRLLPFMDDTKDTWLANLKSIAHANSKNISLMAQTQDWQSALFVIASDTVESLNSAKNETIEIQEKLVKRLDLSVGLFAILLGHLVRDGGDDVLDKVETAASLQRVSLQGQTALLLILSALLSDLFENGTISDVGTITAEDWRKVDLDTDSLLLKQSARLVTDAILSNGAKGLDMGVAIRSWRSLRHLTEIVVAMISKSGFGISELFDYKELKTRAVDPISGGLFGIRLVDGRPSRVSGHQLFDYIQRQEDSSATENDVARLRRRLCMSVSYQCLVLLDAFVFPESLDSSLPASQLHGLALVRDSEPRLGTSQGPLVSSSVRLSLLLLSTLEPSSLLFLQTAGRLRCLLQWALELARESSTKGSSTLDHSQMDRMILAIVLHSHRAAGKCSTLMAEVESTEYRTYFSSREDQKKFFRRLVRSSIELRDIVALSFRGRSSLLKVALSMEAFDDLRNSLEGNGKDSRLSSKESVARDFLNSAWVTKHQDVEIRSVGQTSEGEVAIPEQVSMQTVSISEDETHPNAERDGASAVESIAKETASIVKEFERALDVCFEQYLDSQRRWTDTGAVRELEQDGSSLISKFHEELVAEKVEASKLEAVRRQTADIRWRTIQQSVLFPWQNESHWKLAPYTDKLGRRILMVANRNFDSHRNAQYDTSIPGKSMPLEDDEKTLSEVMKRNAAAFQVHDASSTEESSDDEKSTLHSEGSTSDQGSSLLQKGKENDDLTSDEEGFALETDVEWDNLGTNERSHEAPGGINIDDWAKSFQWSDTESVVARFDHVMLVSLQSFVEGKILLSTHCLYFRQISEEVNFMTRLPMDGSESYGNRRWRLNRLEEVHGRRFMLRPQAAELFFSDSHELFLNFPGGTKERDRFYAKLRNSCRVPLLRSPKTLNPKVVFRKSNLTELWRKRQISNFDYLMALNRMAGRSFNDITQYPVFPWVISDYSSDKLDLNDSRIYRDLSKPVGALNPDRLAQLLDRYKDLELFGFSDAEKFLYGSHYTSPGIVLHYLIRQEPFTSMAIDLQSGRFDCPDRLFFDIQASWNSCMTSTSDMKELIPEFFFFPDMFRNTNHFPLGTTQSGVNVDDVGLPPWAHGSAHEFVRMNRRALESDYVSENLHRWIDLVFGFQQRGAEAEAAHNVFHHLSYEGSVDLDKIPDEIDRQAAESHIQNFGQTPSQLCIDPHPPRDASSTGWKYLIPHDTDLSQNSLRCVTPSKQFCNKRSEFGKGTVLSVQVYTDFVTALYGDMSLGSYRWLPSNRSNRLRMDRIKRVSRAELATSRDSTKRGSAIPVDRTSWSVLDTDSHHFAHCLGGKAREELAQASSKTSTTSRLMKSNEITRSSAEHSSLLISCGYWDDCVKLHSLDNLQCIASETGGHRGYIRCLSVSNDCLLITGGEDATARIWVVGHDELASALSDGYVKTEIGDTSSTVSGQMLTCCHVLWGHETPISSVSIDADLDVAVSGDTDGKICVHTVRKGEYIRSFWPRPLRKEDGASSAVKKVVIDKMGFLIVHTVDGALHSYTINGEHLRTVGAGEVLSDIVVTTPGEIFASGGESGQLVLRRVYDLEIVSILDVSSHGSITCLALTPSELNPIPQFLFVGSDDGMITYVERVSEE